VKRSALVTWVVALVALACTIGFAVAAVGAWRDRQARDLDRAPVDVAERVSRDFFSLDHRTLKADMDKVLALATGEFQAQYQKQSADLRKAVQQKKLVLTARVPDDGAAVEYLGEDSAWVLVSVDVHTESAEAAPQDSRYRTRVVLDRRGGTWRVSRLERVG
jgi:Mce-associated membrane protein